MDARSVSSPSHTPSIDLRVLGGLSVFCDGRECALPPSRKTRALLAYLAVNERPQRRERLCELFWEVPDDPRAALRWSLSRLRPILGQALQANRETATVRHDGISLDYVRLKSGLASNLTDVDVTELEELATLFRGRFLEDLSLPRCQEFEAWRIAHANEMELAELRIRRTLIDRLVDEPDRALVHAQALLVFSPDDRELAYEVEALNDASRRRALSRLAPAPSDPNHESLEVVPQEIRYCVSSDGARIAYACSGAGAPIMKCANWMSHLQYEWESTIWRHWVGGLSEHNRLIRYDQRGNGLSDWEIEDFSFDAQLRDLEAVVEAACPERFALLGISRGCSVSIAYAVRHPERVSHLILYGGRATGWRATGDPTEIERRTAMLTLIRIGWGQDNPAFRQMFTSLFIPGATAEQMNWFNELQRRSISPDNAARYQEAIADIDVSDMLSQVKVPTLVLHALGDAVVPFSAGRALAIGIPGAEFVSLDSQNHILLAGEPAFAQLLSRIRRFIREVAREI